MRRWPQVLWAGAAPWLLAAALSVGVRAQEIDPRQSPADPGFDPMRMEELLSVPVPSLRAALARNPSISDDMLRRLVQDPYDSVATAARAEWRRRTPSKPEYPALPRGAGTKSASPDYAELRALIDGGQGLRAALAWRHLDIATQESLLGVCHFAKATDPLQPLLDFIVMAEPPGGPLAASLAAQIIADDPRQLAEMKARGLMTGLPSFGIYSAALDSHRFRLVRSLAASGLPLDTRGKGGITPLMVAARTGDMEEILLLLELGADANAVDSLSLTAGDHARMALKVDAAEFLARTPAARGRADELRRRFTRAPANSTWVGRWIAVEAPANPKQYTSVVFGPDGTFDMPPGPAGRWSEVDSTHVAGTPMLGEDALQGGTRILLGDLSFERLDTAPAQIQTTYDGSVLRFERAPRDPQADSSNPGSTPAVPASAVARGVAAPLGVKAVASLDKVTLAWAPSDKAVAYFIYRDGVLLTTEPVTDAGYSDNDAPAEATAGYELQAVDSELRASPRSPVARVATILSDTDGSGLPDRWQMRYFGHLGVDPKADPDGDGMTNIEEFRKGTDPNDFYNGVEPVVEPLYGARPGPEDQLALILRHPDGTPWVNAPVPIEVTSGRRMYSAVRNQPPYVRKLVVRTDATGMAQVFLQPLPKP